MQLLKAFKKYKFVLLDNRKQNRLGRNEMEALCGGK